VRGEWRCELAAGVVAHGAEEPTGDGIEKGSGKIGVGPAGDFAGEGVPDAGPVAARVGRQDAEFGDEALDPTLVGGEASGGVILPALPFAAREAAAGAPGHAAELDMPGAEGGGDAERDGFANAHQRRRPKGS